MSTKFADAQCVSLNEKLDSAFSESIGEMDLAKAAAVVAVSAFAAIVRER